MSEETVDEEWIELVQVLIDAGITKEDFKSFVLENWLEKTLEK